MDYKKAQTSVEFLMILAVGLFLIIAIALLSQSQIGNISALKEQNDASNAILDISAAAKEVYAQGIGAKKQVYINLPSSYDPTQSYVANNSMKIKVRSTDYAASEPFNLTGSLPTRSGGQWVWVISEGKSVRIGLQMLSLSRNSIYIIMNRNSSAQTTITATNVWNDTLNVQPVMNWNNPDVTLNYNPQANFSLSSAGNQIESMSFTAAADAVGFYSGELDFISSDGTNTELEIVPITVQVVGFGTGLAPPLTVTPTLWNDTLLPGTNSTKAFTVCTNSQTSLTSVTFTPNPGPPGIWIVNASSLPAMPPSTCLNEILTLAVPNGTTPATYNGFVEVVGQGSTGASATITLNIQVGGDPTDNIGPSVTSMSSLPSKIYTDSPVTFIIIGSDVGLGNNTVKGCEVDMDYQNNWQQMSPTDGAFDQLIEQAKYTYAQGFTLGIHTIRFRCTDFRNNVGEVAIYTIKVMKNFLFVTKGNSATSSEGDWINWMSSNPSAAGFNWEKDTTSESNFADGLVNTTYYSVVIMADFNSGVSDIEEELSDYISAGGRVVFLDASLQQGPKTVGLTSQPGTSGSSTVYIITNNHYITGDFSNSTTISIFSSGGSTNALKSDYLGTKLGSSDSGQTKFEIGDGSGYIIWGASQPANFNSNGSLITTRVLDYSLLQSTIKP